MVRFPASHVLLTRWLNSHMLMVVLVDKSVILLSNSMIKAEGLKWWIIWWLLQGRVESHKKMYCFVFNFQVCLFLGLSWWILIVRHSSTKTLGLKLETIGVQRIWNNWEASCSRSPGRMWSKQEDAKKSHHCSQWISQWISPSCAPMVGPYLVEVCWGTILQAPNMDPCFGHCPCLWRHFLVYPSLPGGSVSENGKRTKRISHLKWPLNDGKLMMNHWNSVVP
jgi:hypothetical protein